MAGLNEDAQWIVMMGFIVSFSLFFLALVINQSTVVGQSTAESVIEFPKNDIRDLQAVSIQAAGISNPTDREVVLADIEVISMSRKNSIAKTVIIPPNPPSDPNIHVMIHYNNGVTEYNENWTSY
jgi:hypothetical protein